MLFRIRFLTLVAFAIGMVVPVAAHAAPAFEAQLSRNDSEMQKVMIDASGGQFKLRYGADTTTDLAFDATASAVRAAIGALPAIAAGGGSVSVSRSIDPVGGVSEYGITFDGGPLKGTDVPLMAVVKGSTPLSGGLHKGVVDTLLEAGVRRGDQQVDYQIHIKNTGADPTTGTVTSELTLPAGSQAGVVRFFDPANPGAPPAGWSCAAQPTKATCTSSSVLAAGASYPAIGVSARLSADTPGEVATAATVAGGGAATVTTNDAFDLGPANPFGVQAFETEITDANNNDYTQAGGHPYAGSETFIFNSFAGETSNEHPERPNTPTEPIKTIRTDLPRGFVGNALAVPQLCPSTADVLASTCPDGSAVGQISLDINLGANFGRTSVPLYSIVPEYGLPAQFAFAVTQSLQSVFTIAPHLRADEGYALSLEATPAPVTPGIRAVSDVTLCGFGAKVTSNVFKGCMQASDPAANPIPLITTPTRCSGAPPTSRLEVDSWEHPGTFASRETTDPLPTGCDQVAFEPDVKLEPTNHEAESPTGINVEITMPTEGVEDSEGVSQAMLDNATVTFPRGMSINPAAAQGLGACTLAQLKFHSNDEDDCPESSKIGSVEIDTPVIRSTLTGNVYVAAQKDNPFDSTLGLYLVFDSKKDGILVKVAGKLTPDPVTGQLTATFTENPEYPFSRLSMRFPQGPRSPLINPPACGAYAIHSEMSPWSAVDPADPTPAEIVSADSTYEVTSGPNGGPCPNGNLDPKLNAGLNNPTAGARSPFVLDLSRADGTQRFTALDVTMPPGLTAYLKGVPYCPDSVLAGISAAELTGRPELANPSCPAASQVGTVQAGAGAGSYPFYAPGRAYLAGPYKGAPVSLAIVTPAVAGPFDLGNVVVRNGLYVDPATAQVTVKSDPIPTILHGLLLDIRSLRVAIDRPGFTTAPTNCEPMSIEAVVGGESGASATASNRFQVGNCAALALKPKLKLQLIGGTKRNRYPSLKAVLTQPEGQANIGRVSVMLPHSEFLEQGHIGTVCTRVQFNAVPRACPAKSVYGEAEAWSPLLDQPLSGPVYLRSNGGERDLPDLVAALKGPAQQPIEVDHVGYNDSKNARIRNTFALVPDAPVSRFVLTMQGGKKGLLVNSHDLCTLKPAARLATERIVGQNGRQSTQYPLLENQCHGKRGHSNPHGRARGR
jgi:hypothetical protein